MNRAGESIASGHSTPMPPITVAALLVSHARDCGLWRHGGYGPIPISAQELAAWAAGTGAELGPDDFQSILDASRTYVSAYCEYDTVSANPPWSPEETEAEAAARTKAEERFFDMLMGVGGNDG